MESSAGNFPQNVESQNNNIYYFRASVCQGFWCTGAGWFWQVVSNEAIGKVFAGIAGIPVLEGERHFQDGTLTWLCWLEASVPCHLGLSKVCFCVCMTGSWLASE